MKKLTLLFSALILTLGCFSQETIPYTDDFNSYASEDEFQEEWTYINNNADAWIFDYTAYFGEGSSNAPVFTGNYYENGDDWLVSPSLYFEAGTNYTLKFSYTGLLTGGYEKLKVFIGDDITASAMTTQIVDLGSFTTSDYGNTFTISTTDFTVSTSGTYYIGFYAYSDANSGGITIDNFAITEITDITEINTNKTPNNMVSLYPNPTTGIINVETTDNATVAIYNELGEFIKSIHNINGHKTIDISNYNQGVYIIRIITENEVITKKVNLLD